MRENPLDVGAGRGGEESFVGREREEVQAASSLRAGARAPPSCGVQTWGSHGYISQATLVVSNRYQLLIT